MPAKFCLFDLVLIMCCTSGELLLHYIHEIFDISFGVNLPGGIAEKE